MSFSRSFEGSTSRLSGFRSRWQIRRECTYSSAFNACERGGSWRPGGYDRTRARAARLEQVNPCVVDRKPQSLLVVLCARKKTLSSAERGGTGGILEGHVPAVRPSESSLA
mgnify:CR=1 FL=1|jgi:hypothetical protein